MANSENEIERDIESLIGTMALSGATLSDKCIEDCRAILRGELNVDAHVAELIEKYRLEGKNT